MWSCFEGDLKMSQESPKNITLLDVKNALKDPEFVRKLPENLAPDIQKIQSNPNCSCNIKIYEKLLTEAKEVFATHFPEKGYESPKEVLAVSAQNNWSVINCNVNELEFRLRSLPPGRKQVVLSRYEDQVTVIVNELGQVF
jgi:hypothetical protein